MIPLEPSYTNHICARYSVSRLYRKKRRGKREGIEGKGIGRKEEKTCSSPKPSIIFLPIAI